MKISYNCRDFQRGSGIIAVIIVYEHRNDMRSGFGKKMRGCIKIKVLSSPFKMSRNQQCDTMLSSIIQNCFTGRMRL